MGTRLKPVYNGSRTKCQKLVIQKGTKGLQQRAPTPMNSGYQPELDVSPELSPDDTSYFQLLIGILRWAVKLRCVNITTEVSMLLSHLALPWEGHLHKLFHIFAYLKKKSNSRMVFDPTYPEID